MRVHVTYSFTCIRHIHAHVYVFYVVYMCIQHIRMSVCINIYIYSFIHMHIHIANFDGANVRKILKRSFAQDTGNGECLC